MSNLAANSIKLSEAISDTTKRNACIAAAFATVEDTGLDEPIVRRLQAELEIA